MTAELCMVSHPLQGADSLASFLVESRLAACVQLLPPMTSVYRWNQSIETSQEVLMLIKSTSDNRMTLQSALVEKHPYEVPEILFFTADSGLPAYLDWIIREAGSGSGK